MDESGAKALKLLIVEDSEDLVAIWKILFRQAGYSARFCTSGERAVSTVEEGYALDVLITDYYLPDLTGLQVIEQVRARRPQVHFLMITGNTDAAFVRSMDEQGIALLFKPAKFDDLEARLHAMTL